MPINTNVASAVFDGARAVIDGTQAVAEGAMNTYNTVQRAFTNPQQIGADFSRRDYAAPVNQAPVYAYQPPVYPWAAHQYQQGYSFANAMTQPMANGYGYAGISNPQYGRIGYTQYTSGGNSQASAPMLGAGFQYTGIGGWQF